MSNYHVHQWYMEGHRDWMCCSVTGCKEEQRAVEHITELEAENAETHELVTRLSGLLAGIALGLKGEPSELVWHSFHDLPEIAVRMREDSVNYQQLIKDLLHGRQTATPPTGDTQ